MKDENMKEGSMSDDPRYGKQGEWMLYDQCRPSQGILGVLCVYIDVGQLPPEKAEAFVERVRESMDLSRIKAVCEVFFFPVRNNPTRVEFVPFTR